jgi:hypothetical protein
VTLFNPHGTVVKMFVVCYDLGDMPPSSQTFVRQRTFFMPVSATLEDAFANRSWLRYLIHLRFATSRSNKLYLHSDIRMLFSHKSDLEAASNLTGGGTAHVPPYRSAALSFKTSKVAPSVASLSQPEDPQRGSTNRDSHAPPITSSVGGTAVEQSRAPLTSPQQESQAAAPTSKGSGYDSSLPSALPGSSVVAPEALGNGEPNFELRSFTEMPKNPKYSPRRWTTVTPRLTTPASQQTQTQTYRR